ncbi:hypothetical protein P2318_10260 [Myxococcaceae bacterium GXIMD 01537]
MRHRILVVLLALGTVGGYASGFAHLARRGQACPGWAARAQPSCAPCPSAEPPPASTPR